MCQLWLKQRRKQTNNRTKKQINKDTQKTDRRLLPLDCTWLNQNTNQLSVLSFFSVILCNNRNCLHHCTGAVTRKIVDSQVSKLCVGPPAIWHQRLAVSCFSNDNHKITLPTPSTNMLHAVLYCKVRNPKSTYKPAEWSQEFHKACVALLMALPASSLIFLHWSKTSEKAKWYDRAIIKVRLSATHFMWKLVLFAYGWKLIFYARSLA